MTNDLLDRHSPARLLQILRKSRRGFLLASLSVVFLLFLPAGGSADTTRPDVQRSGAEHNLALPDATPSVETDATVGDAQRTFVSVPAGETSLPISQLGSLAADSIAVQSLESTGRAGRAVALLGRRQGRSMPG